MGEDERVLQLLPTARSCIGHIRVNPHRIGGVHQVAKDYRSVQDMVVRGSNTCPSVGWSPFTSVSPSALTTIGVVSLNGPLCQY